MAPGDLQEVLAGIKPGEGRELRDLLVGLGRADDAAVYRLTPEIAIVETVDFFPPVVDDAYTWGAVAAVNAMSDVYAMGGEVLFALAVAGFPRELPKAIIAEVFRGGAEKVAEAGGVIAGGHTVVDGAVKSMLRLNRVAAQVAQAVGARGATDITGFGLLGHAMEMVEASGAGIRISAARLPILPGARELAEQGQFSGGMKRNRRHVDTVLGARLVIDASVPAALVGLLSEAETSGGLLFGVPRERASQVAGEFTARGETCAEIGEVTAEPSIAIVP